MRFLLTALLVFGIFAGISSAFHGPRWGWHGYGYGYGGAPCGSWYYGPPQQYGAPPQPYAPQQPAAPATPNAPPPAPPR